MLRSFYYIYIEIVPSGLIGFENTDLSMVNYFYEFIFKINLRVGVSVFNLADIILKR